MDIRLNARTSSFIWTWGAPAVTGHGDTVCVSWTWGHSVCELDMGTLCVWVGHGDTLCVSWTWGHRGGGVACVCVTAERPLRRTVAVSQGQGRILNNCVSRMLGHPIPPKDCSDVLRIYQWSSWSTLCDLKAPSTILNNMYKVPFCL